jgi:excisionase family DNA binding protein
MVDNYLTPEQIAQRLQFHVESVYRLLRTGKLPGVHISRKAWRITEHDLRSFMKSRNAADLLFEKYLAEYGLGVAGREPVVPENSGRISYKLRFKGKVLRFEVKELTEGAESLGLGGGILDPHLGIRREIDEVTEKFREFADESCCLVLYSRNLNLAEICTPSVVLDAMLGHVSWRVPIIPERGGAGGTSRQVHAGGGQADRQTSKPTNTSIGAVIAVEKIAVGQRAFHNALAKKEREEDRRLPWEEIRGALQRRKDKYERTVLRVLVFENPYANKRLPADIFAGPFDVRWGPEPGAHCMKRTYVGPELAKLEAAEDELGLNPTPLQQKTKRQRKTLPAGNLFAEF